MPRAPRQYAVSGIYHVVIKGIDNRAIFQETKDFQKFIDILSLYKETCDFKLYAYCLMSNHVHLLLRTSTASISAIFQRINTKYAIWFNMKYRRNGYLFGSRFYSEPVEDIEYLFNVVRYIHYNPTKAKIEMKPGHSYRWSSFLDYRIHNCKLVDTEEIIDAFHGELNFYDFHSQDNNFECLDIDKLRSRIPDDVAREIMQEFTACSTVEEFQSLGEQEMAAHLRTLHENGLSIRQLNRLTGLSKGTIERKLRYRTST